MAYNLESLIRILEQILHPGQDLWILDHKRPQIECLLEKASSLKKILENSSPAGSQRAESLESQIRDAAHKAEDIIESHMVDRMLSKPGGKSFTISPPDLQQVIQELDSAMGKMMKNMDTGSKMPNGSTSGGSFVPDPSSKDTVVGLDEDLLKLKHRLTGDQSKLEIIPIVGMGGIGKTTLAQNLYNDQFIVSHFHTCAWITISQDHNVRAILLGLLGCILGKLTDELLQAKNNKLGVALHKSLFGRRYLIVLDDMWSTNAWDDVKMFFPIQNHRSRIILTTRELDVANYVDLSSPKHQMHLLNKPESWNLLHQIVFGKENCPTELERIGKNIASNCGGLPLAIHVIGGLLSKAERTRDSWEHVANNIRAAIAETDEHFFNILSLSYNHLPNHLKPCFMYMGAFPEDYEIRASKLIRLWVAEGFLKSNDGDKCLEEEAEDNLKALVDRNLVFVRQHKSNGKAESYSIHDLLRDLCLKKADVESFLYVKNRQVQIVPKDSSHCHLRRVSVHPSYRIRDVYASQEFMSLARTFLCVDLASREILSPVFLGLRLLRVLDVFDINFHQFPNEILQLVNLRYLAFICNSDLPSALSRLWNLQTLIVRSDSWYTILPSEIWEMSELRHVKFKKTVIFVEDNYRHNFIQEKLQTISVTRLTELVESNLLGSIPNIKSLGIYVASSPVEFVDLSHLHKLETLKWSSYLDWDLRTFLSMVRFPPSLRKLTLRKCTIPWRFMITVSSLTNLEVLKIRKCAFEGQEIQSEDEHELEATEEEEEEEESEATEEEESEATIEEEEEEEEEEEKEKEEEWKATEEEFCSLQFLLLENLKLVHWRADDSHFPKLRHLVIRRCSELKKVPGRIGETLELIELYECRPCLVRSARKIQKEQSDLGNDLQVRIL